MAQGSAGAAAAAGGAAAAAVVFGAPLTTITGVATLTSHGLKVLIWAAGHLTDEQARQLKAACLTAIIDASPKEQASKFTKRSLKRSQKKVAEALNRIMAHDAPTNGYDPSRFRERVVLQWSAVETPETTEGNGTNSESDAYESAAHRMLELLENADWRDHLKLELMEVARKKIALEGGGADLLDFQRAITDINDLRPWADRVVGQLQWAMTRSEALRPVLLRLESIESQAMLAGQLAAVGSIDRSVRAIKHLLLFAMLALGIVSTAGASAMLEAADMFPFSADSLDFASDFLNFLR